MTKFLVGMVASLVTLIATSGGANAAFTVTATSPSFGAQTISATDAGGANSNSSSFVGSTTVTLVNSTVGFFFLQNPANLALTSTQSGTGGNTIFNSLNSSFTLRNRIDNAPGDFVGNIVITITQNAYDFSSRQNFLNTTYSLTSSGSAGNTDFVYSTSINSPTTTITTGVPILLVDGVAKTGGFGQTIGVTPITNTGTITQTFTIRNLAAGESIVFNVTSTLSTPLPATGLMAAVGFPLLGLAGAFRRRVLG